LSVAATSRFDWFTNRPGTRIFHLTEENILLVPELALLAVSLATLLFTASFDWLYPLRVVVVGAILFHLRKSFNLGTLRLNPLAIGIGIAIFFMWIMVVPASAEKSQAFSTALFSAPYIGVACWILFRTVGAIIIVPFAEELAFRGFLLSYLEKTLSGFSSPARQIGATLISSLFFGALHGSWLAGTLAGIGIAGARYHRGQLFDAISAHMTANLLLGAYVLTGGHWSYW
jgi:CAAX prenyl protease-like protein